MVRNSNGACGIPENRPHLLFRLSDRRPQSVQRVVQLHLDSELPAPGFAVTVEVSVQQDSFGFRRPSNLGNRVGGVHT